MAWVVIAGTRYDAESIADEDLFGDIIGNIEHVFDGTDISTGLVTQDSIAAAAVGQGELKTAQETVSSALAPGASTNFTWSSVGQYGFMLQSSTGAGTAAFEYYPGGYQIAAGLSQATRLGVYNAGGGTVTAFGVARYMTATAPFYVVGPRPWGMFLYAVVQGSKILSAWSAEDAPGYVQAASRLVLPNGAPAPQLRLLQKSGPLLHLRNPTPFADWTRGRDVGPGLPPQQEPVVPAGARVVLLDLRDLEDDDGQVWRPDVVERDAKAAQAAALPAGDLRAIYKQEADRLAARCAEVDAEQAEARAALNRFPATMDEFAQAAADVEVKALDAQRERSRKAVDDINRALLANLALSPAAVANLVERKESVRRYLAKIDGQLLPRARSEVAGRLQRARQQAERNYPVALRRLRTAAGILTKRQRLELELQDEGGNFHDLLYGTSGNRYRWEVDPATGQQVKAPTSQQPRTRHPAIEAALGGIPMHDARHPESGDVPKIPGLFVPNQDGEQAVTILSAG